MSFEFLYNISIHYSTSILYNLISLGIRPLVDSSDTVINVLPSVGGWSRP